MAKRKIISRCLKDPIGCSPLREMVKGKERILIVTDDFTRQTPLKEILPALLDELKHAGIRDEQIKIIVASGTHRPMKKNELRTKFGKDVLSCFRIYNHSWNDKSALTRINSSINGRRICVNRLAKDSDFIIGVGSILPHATTGFSGGGKIILPGICGRDTVEDMHWKALDFEIRDILGIYNNPMRKMVDSVAKKTGLKFIVNVITNGCNRIAGVVAGDPVRAHRKGVKIAKKVFGRRFPHKADIVVADAAPMDIDLRQAIKAVAVADLVVKRGGVIVLKARCPEGVSPQFPGFTRYGFSDPEGLKKKVETGKIKGRLMAYTLIAIGRILRCKAKVIIISAGISSNVAESMGFLSAGSLNDALVMAKGLTGEKARIVRFKRACEVLPLFN